MNFIFHIDIYLGELIKTYGLIVYAILFIVVLCETGLVITPFLPGDSLLFAAGTFCAIGALDLLWVIILLSTAATIGDTINYWIGHYIGPKAFSFQNSRFFRREYLDRTYAFYKKKGGKIIMLARFLPFIRTFAPFVAGIGVMNYKKFIIYNIGGALIWVASLTLAGYFFADLSIVKNYFSLVIVFIIVISLIPIIIDFYLTFI